MTGAARRHLVAAVVAISVTCACANAHAQDDDLEPTLRGFTTTQGVLLGLLTGCFVSNAFKAEGFVKGMGVAGCVTLASLPVVSTTTSAIVAVVESGDDARRRGEALALEYVRHESRALAEEVALGGGPNTVRLRGLLEVAVGGHVDGESLARCITRRRLDLLGGLARGGEGHARATRALLSCARVARRRHPQSEGEDT